MREKFTIELITYLNEEDPRRALIRNALRDAAQNVFATATLFCVGSTPPAIELKVGNEVLDINTPDDVSDEAHHIDEDA